jgi:hypothetical protein
MQQTHTGSSQVFRYDNVLGPQTCNEICTYLLREKGEHMSSDSELLPWRENDVFNYRNMADYNLINKINLHRHAVKNLVMMSFKQMAYIEYTDLVVWRTGKSQDRHKDNGYKENDSLKNRKFTTVTYLNESFVGGNTFIQTENGDDYISFPKQGSVVLYYADERATHGVTEVESGIRFTLPIWFCTDYFVSEEERYRAQDNIFN